MSARWQSAGGQAVTASPPHPRPASQHPRKVRIVGPPRAGMHQQAHHTELWPPLFGAVVSTRTKSEPGESPKQQMWPVPRDWKEHSSERCAGPRAPHSSHLRAWLPPSCHAHCHPAGLRCPCRVLHRRQLRPQRSVQTAPTKQGPEADPCHTGLRPHQALSQGTLQLPSGQSLALGAQFCLCSLKRRHDWVAGSGRPRSQPKP